MSKISFKDLPLVVKAAVFVSFFTAWVMFEEFVIDRHGLWRFLPFYRVGLFCVWDVLALVAIACGLLWSSCPVRRLLHRCPACA